MMGETSTGLMKLNQITTKMCIKLISLHRENFFEFVFPDYITQTPFEIYEKTSGRIPLICASNHFLTHI